MHIELRFQEAFALQIFIQPVNDDNLLCVAHTCFNLLGRFKLDAKTDCNFADLFFFHVQTYHVTNRREN